MNDADKTVLAETKALPADYRGPLSNALVSYADELDAAVKLLRDIRQKVGLHPKREREVDAFLARHEGRR